jgi:hypothetical protein
LVKRFSLAALVAELTKNERGRAQERFGAGEQSADGLAELRRPEWRFPVRRHPRGPPDAAHGSLDLGAFSCPARSGNDARLRHVII